MGTEAKFWMVVVDGKDGPSKRHKSYAVACAEAERLCEKEHGNVYVLETVRRHYPKFVLCWEQM